MEWVPYLPWSTTYVTYEGAEGPPLPHGQTNTTENISVVGNNLFIGHLQPAQKSSDPFETCGSAAAVEKQRWKLCLPLLLKLLGCAETWNRVGS